MAQVPVQRGPEVQPGNTPSSFQRIDASPDAFGAQVGAANSRLGATLEQSGQLASEAAIQFQKIQNQANVDDTYATKFDPAFRDLYQKYYSLQGKTALDQMPQYIEQMDKLRNELKSSLPNEPQRHQFDQDTRRRVQIEMDGMARYADNQNKVWQAQTSEAFLRTQRNMAGDKYNNDKDFGLAIGSGLAEIDRYGAQTGQSSEVMRERSAKFVSDTWHDRITRMAVDDPRAALDLYRKNTKAIEAPARTALETHLRQRVLPVETRDIARQVIAGHPMADPEKLEPAVVGDPLVQAVVGQESSGNPKAVSKKGALGLMQLMPDTARMVATKMGLPYDEKLLTADTPEGREYNVKLGTQYLRDMMTRYSGNQTMALAAYNAGPDRVDAWVARFGNPNHGGISSEDWAAKIPFKETRDYVAKINGRVQPSPGTQSSSVDIRAHLASWVAEGEAAAQKMYPNDPIAADMVTAHIKSYAATIVSAKDGIEKQARDDLVTTVLNNKTITSLDSLLADPKVQQAWANSTPQVQSAIIHRLTTNAKGIDPPFNEAAKSTYMELMGKAANDPEAFATEKLEKYMDVLPGHIFKQLVDMQTIKPSKQAQAEAKAQNIQHAKEVAMPMARAAGLKSNGKPGSTDAQRYDQFVGRLSVAMDQYHDVNKKQPDDKAIMAMSNALLTQGAQRDSGIIWNKRLRAFETDPSQFYVPVPKDEHKKITAEYKKVYGKEPSDEDVRQVYTSAQLQRGAKK